MKPYILLIATLLVACFVFSTECVLRTTYWYQSTSCQGTSFLMTIRDSTTGCNVTNCTPYSAEPSVLSQSYECPNSYPQNPPLKSGEITIYSYSDTASCSATTINRYDVYKTNVCIKSSIIFGPSSKSGQYIGCDKMIMYSDDACQTVFQTIPVTLNNCASGKINKCLSVANSTNVTPPKNSSHSHTIPFGSMIILHMTVLFGILAF